MKPRIPAIVAIQRPACRERLLKAARALFLLTGLDAVTVDDICSAANVSKGGFYHHFRDKEHLFLLVALEELRRELDLVTCPAPKADSGGRADALLLDLWSWAPRHPRARRRVRDMHRKALRDLSRLDRTGMKREPAGGDREAAAMLVLILGTGRMARGALASQANAAERRQKKAAAG